MYSHKSFFVWCRTAVSGIKYRPDRTGVEVELHEHLEDRYESFIECGFEPDAAADKTVEAMGSAENVAKQLSRIYNPFWPYMLRISRVVLVLLILITIFPLMSFVKDNIYYARNASPDSSYIPYVDYNPYVHTAYQEKWISSERMSYFEPEYSGSINGLPTAVTNAAWWRSEYEYDNRTEVIDLLHIRLEMKHPYLLLSRVGMDVKDFVWAEDSLGNYYYRNAESRYGGGFSSSYTAESYVYGTYRNGGWGTYVFELALINYVSQDAEWVDLHYDRDSRDYVLRIYLPGGNAL